MGEGHGLVRRQAADAVVEHRNLILEIRKLNHEESNTRRCGVLFSMLDYFFLLNTMSLFTYEHTITKFCVIGNIQQNTLNFDYASTLLLTCMYAT